jgi:hypothetical protein
VNIAMLDSPFRIAVCLLLITSAVARTQSFESSDRSHPVIDSQFRSLFDGKTLDGWVTTGGRYDGKAVWGVEDGAITGREGPNHAGGLIYTEGYYSSFVFSCEAWVSYPFDSGIFLRMVPRKEKLKGAQITIDYREKGEVGGIYADGWLQHNKDGKQAYKRDEWNKFVVECVGSPMHIRVWMNGRLITDYRLSDETQGFARSGRIGLQVHGGRKDPPNARAQFRNIKIRELPDHDDRIFSCDAAGKLSATELGKRKGWARLFNGRDLTGWEPVGGGSEGYAVRDGMLVFPAKGGGGYIRTTEDFRDFELRMDFKVLKMANSGLFLRGNRAGGNPAYSGCEIQILDDHNWEESTKSKLKPWQFTGSLYGAVAPAVDAFKPLGHWNSFEVTYQEARLQVLLNGRELYDVDTLGLSSAKPPFAKRAQTGFIGLQRHSPGGKLESDAFAWFSNIFIRKL